MGLEESFKFLFQFHCFLSEIRSNVTSWKWGWRCWSFKDRSEKPSSRTVAEWRDQGTQLGSGSTGAHPDWNSTDQTSYHLSPHPCPAVKMGRWGGRWDRCGVEERLNSTRAALLWGPWGKRRVRMSMRVRESRCYYVYLGVIIISGCGISVG